MPDPDHEPRRILPAPPAADPEMGEIRWQRWEHALALTHVDPSCEACDYPGPLRTAIGKTLYQPPPRRTLVRRSRVAQGRRPVWGPAVTPEPYWAVTHWAVRCPRCDTMTAYRRRDWVEIHYHPPTTTASETPAQATLF